MPAEKEGEGEALAFAVNWWRRRSFELQTHLSLSPSMADAVRLSYQSPMLLPFRPSSHTPKLSLLPLKQHTPDLRWVSTVQEACNQRLRLSSFKVPLTADPLIFLFLSSSYSSKWGTIMIKDQENKQTPIQNYKKKKKKVNHLLTLLHKIVMWGCKIIALQCPSSAGVESSVAVWLKLPHYISWDIPNLMIFW